MNMDGCPWLLGYLAKKYYSNLISLTKRKWRAFIKDSVDVYGINQAVISVTNQC